MNYTYHLIYELHLPPYELHLKQMNYTNPTDQYLVQSTLTFL